MKKFSVLLFLFLSIKESSAQTPGDSLLIAADLEECVQYALRHQPAIEQASIDEQITNYNIKNRLADWYPQINANYNVQHVFQRQTSFFNGTAVPVGVRNTSFGQFSLNQAIFNRDVLLASRTKADVRLQSTQQTQAVKIDIAAEVSKAFYDVLTTRQQIQVANENIARLQKSLNDAFYRYQSGVTDKTDYKRAQIALNNTTATKQANEAALVAKLEFLKSLMGYPISASLTVVYDSLKMEREIPFDTLQPLDYLKRVEYQQLATQKRLQSALVRYERNGFLPTISANGAYNMNYLNNDFGKLYGENYPYSYIGLTAGISIFQGGKRRTNVRAAELQLARTDLDLVNLQNEINSQYAAALSAYKANLASYRASKANVDLAQEVYAVIELQYRAGVKTYLEVIASETDLRTAQINYYNALYQVLASKVDAERALGLKRY
jgi:outer membrane protein TolC